MVAAFVQIFLPKIKRIYTRLTALCYWSKYIILGNATQKQNRARDYVMAALRALLDDIVNYAWHKLRLQTGRKGNKFGALTCQRIRCCFDERSIIDARGSESKSMSGELTRICRVSSRSRSRTLNGKCVVDVLDLNEFRCQYQAPIALTCSSYLPEPYKRVFLCGWR